MRPDGAICCRASFVSGGAAIRNPEQNRINRDIREREVRLIEEGGAGRILSIEEALRLAEDAGLDLVEVAPDAKPVVCKIFDYKKALYEKKKKLKEAKKHAKQIELKEVKLRVAIDAHDRDLKLKHAREFLEDGDKVKFTIVFRGREITRPEMGDRLIEAVKENLKDIGEVEQPPARFGKQLVLVMARRKDWVAPKAPKPARPEAPKAPKAEAKPEKPAEKPAAP